MAFSIETDEHGVHHFAGNPAELLKALLLHKGDEGGITEDDLDIESFTEWAEYCDELGLTVDCSYPPNTETLVDTGAGDGSIKAVIERRRLI
ncbi:MAG: hypothetical protein U0105_17370 [Candidatus Obscuribacterales bacterium]